MQTTGKQKADIKKEYGKPIGEVLLELLNQGHTQTTIANMLGVRQGTISYHVRKAGITRTTKAIYVIEGN